MGALRSKSGVFPSGKIVPGTAQVQTLRAIADCVDDRRGALAIALLIFSVWMEQSNEW